MFYNLLRPFKSGYDNFRDDHMLFRHFTRSPGLIRETDNSVDIILIPQACFPPKVITIFKALKWLNSLILLRLKKMVFYNFLKTHVVLSRLCCKN